MKMRLPSKISFKNSNLSQALAGQFPRLVTGIILAAILLACLLLGGPLLTLAMAFVGVIGLFEFFQLCWPGKTRIPTKIFGLVMAALLFCPVGELFAVRVLLALVFVWAVTAFMIDYSRGNDSANILDQAALLLGFVYIPLILSMALALTMREQFLAVTAAIASDIAAYYVGCAFGKHKIWPRVSPNKSWEGSLAGLVACVLAVVAINAMPDTDGPLLDCDLIVWAFIGVFLAVSAQMGDFFESALKRSRQVKNSSEILPGHGGILDRIDSILFVIAAYGMVKLIAAHVAGIGSMAA